MGTGQYSYALDTTGQLPANLIVGETHTVTAVNDRTYHFIIPTFAPFHANSVRLEEAKELCEKNITSSELEMYREDGSIYRKRLGLAPDKLQIVKI
jgi:hypothetical protein